MKKTEIKNASDQDLITEYVIKYSLLVFNSNREGGTKQLSAQCLNLEDELLKRGLLTEENLRRLRA